MDKLAMAVREHYQNIMKNLVLIDSGTEREKAQSLMILDDLLSEAAALEHQVAEISSDSVKTELDELLKAAQRAKVVKKREKDKAYQKKKIKQIKLSLNKDTDADIIEILDSKDNVQGYLKEMIRKDGKHNA